jgi:ABC-2 type transport system ATP-binding protein
MPWAATRRIRQSQDMTDALAIRLAGIGKDYGSLTAVTNVSLEVARGEVVALLGPNGAGKSTTIDLALGLTNPTRGSAELFGGNPRDAIVAGRVGAMLQGGALLPTQTVEQAVGLIAAAHRNPLPVAEALERARVTDIAKQRVSKLSGGQMQRARFAVAIVSNPDLLILDEPTAAMDVEARRIFWASIRELTDDGRTVVFATHYLDEADAFADRIVIMSSGAIVADGTPSEIKSVVQGRVVSATVTDAATANEWLGSRPEVLATEHRGHRVTARTSDSDTTLRDLLAGWPDAHDIEVVPRTMDDAFLALTASTQEVTP